MIAKITKAKIAIKDSYLIAALSSNVEPEARKILREFCESPDRELLVLAMLDLSRTGTEEVLAYLRKEVSTDSRLSRGFMWQDGVLIRRIAVMRAPRD